jgi:hypothetical protein
MGEIPENLRQAQVIVNYRQFHEVELNLHLKFMGEIPENLKAQVIVNYRQFHEVKLNLHFKFIRQCVYLLLYSTYFQ